MLSPATRTITLINTDLERFDHWMHEHAIVYERAANTRLNPDAMWAIFGRDKSDRHHHFYEFCAVTQDDWPDVAFDRGYLPDKPIWIYRPRNPQGVFTDKLIIAWFAATDYTFGEVKVEYWVHERANGFDALLQFLTTDFEVKPTSSADVATEPGTVDPPAAQLEAPERAITPWANEPWYLNLTIDDRGRYDRLRPYKERWEAGEMTNRELAETFGLSEDTIRRWRRELARRGAPDMDWKPY